MAAISDPLLAWKWSIGSAVSTTAPIVTKAAAPKAGFTDPLLEWKWKFGTAVSMVAIAPLGCGNPLLDWKWRIGSACQGPAKATKKATVKPVTAVKEGGPAVKEGGPAVKEAGTAVKEGGLLGFGNPLLDITVVTDTKFLAKYKLDANNAILADATHKPMFAELANMKPEYMAGGATLNTIRVAQWLLQKPFATTFFGCVGKDKNATILREKNAGVGVKSMFQVDEATPTGTCAAVITNQDRSLITELGAALKFSHTFLQKPENWEYVKKASVYYVCGFPFSVSPPSVKLIAEHACAENKTLVMNLSAPFLIPFFINKEINIMPYIDIMFGNESEAAEFCKQMNIKASNIQEMALAVSKLPKQNAAKKRIVIFTQGRDPTVVAYDGKVALHPILPIDPALIRDTNGCGDSFVGGFLSQLVLGKPVEECLKCGAYAAKVVIQYFGCTYPEKPDFK